MSMPAVSPAHCTTSIRSLGDHREAAAQIPIFRACYHCVLTIEWFIYTAFFSMSPPRRAELVETLKAVQTV